MDVKLKKLLEDFGLLDDEKKVVVYMLGFLTDPTLEPARSKTYNDSEFYNLLNSTSLFHLKIVISNIQVNIMMQAEIQSIIEKIRLNKFREELINEFESVSFRYKESLKYLFKDEYINDLTGVNIAARQKDYEPDFMKVKNRAIRVLDVENLLTGLLPEEKSIIDKLRSSATALDTGDIPYRTYNSYEFDKLLVGLGCDRVKEMIKVHLDILNRLNEAQLAIQDVKNYDERETLQKEFDKYYDDYYSGIKARFNILGEFDEEKLNRVYVQAIGDIYSSNFIRLKDTARNFENIELLYNDELSEDESEIIDNIRLIVTNPDIGRHRGTINARQFDLLLGGLDIHKIRDIIKFHLSTNAIMPEIEVLIEKVKKEESRNQLRNVFFPYKSRYQARLKSFFSKSSDYLYRRVMKNNNYFIPSYD
ncbi:hypothetical protein bcCo53_001264 (plasmid) [Borrelia coriaceae]|nr:hypothetical protein [Borrelia coriaceae]UPA17095.1 hypothetical protein bcCo53_001264 [Borrelia coriaceae]